MRPRFPRSLFGQVVLLHIATVVVAALTLPFAISLLLERTAATYQRAALTRQALAIEEGLVRGGGGRWHVALGPTLAGLYRAGYDGRAFGVVAADGTVLAASPTLDAAVLRDAPRLDRPQTFTARSIESLTWPARRFGDRIWIVVSQDVDDPDVVTDDIVRTFLSRFLLILLPLLLLVPLIGALLLRRTTARIIAASRRAGAIGPTNLTARIPLTALPREVLPLAEATNKALDRLEQGYRTQSEFVGNVAHELRTPLAIIDLQIEALPAGTPRDRLHATVRHAAHVVSQLLDLASLERLSIGEAERFDLQALARDVVERTAPAIFAGGRTIGASEGDAPVWVAGRAPLISLALANLIDNAVRHTPPGTAIEVAVDPRGAVAVSDDGPGLAHVDVAVLTRRFWRADQARSDSAGIGLSIVQRIVDAHHGRLRVDRGHRAGARFEVHLAPAAQ